MHVVFIQWIQDFCERRAGDGLGDHNADPRCQECDTLIDYCEPRFGRSSVVGDAEGNVHVHQTRTSCDVGLRRNETALIARIEARLAARRAKNWAESDRIRDELAAAGIVLEDKPGGVTSWRRQ